MLYPSLSKYGEYDESDQGRQDMNNSYNNSRQPVSDNHYAAQAPYPGSIAHSRYSPSGYDWPSQPQQQNYSSSSRRRQLGGDGWSDRFAQSTSHDEGSQASSYATQAAAETSGHTYYNPASTTQSTQGLSSLAYASGLDDARSQRHEQQTQRSSVPSASRYSSTAVSQGLNRVRSPATTKSTSQYNPTPSTNENYSCQTNSSSQSQGHTLSAAATALAGAVSARFSQASAAMGGQSASPVMASSAAPQHSAPQRSASPHRQAPSAKTQAQRYESSSTPQRNYKAFNAVAYQIRIPAVNSSERDHGPSKTSSQRPSQTQPQPINSISNLVTHSPEERPATQYSTAGETQSMPSYIDPTQVFNPYAKEHERRRREAIARAEAETRRQEMEEAAAAKRKAEEEAAATAAERDRAEEAAAAKKRDQKAAAASRKAKSRQNARNAAANAQPHPAAVTSPQLDQRQTGAALSEPDMAAELKVMMEKMKEFRNKDPGLFQKLWEDMRKPTSGPLSVVTIQSPSPQMSTQQPLPHGGHHSAAVMLPAQQLELGPQPASITPAKAKRSRRSQVPFEVPLGAKVNGYKVVVEDNEEGLPDLGRFPAERRIRHPYPPKISTETETPAESPAESPAQPVHGKTAHAHPVVSDQTPTAPSQEAPVPPLQPHVSAPTAPSAEKATPLTQGLPLRGPAGGTIWPEEKRNALAEAAVTTLKAVPENAAIEISPEDIHGMLERNPSYIDLCELLEKKGLKFHRGHFARQLLSNVPYLNGPQGKATPTPVIPTPTQQPNGTPSLPTQPIAAVAIPPGTPASAGNSQFQAVNGGANSPVFKPERPAYTPQYLPGVGLQTPRTRPGRPHPLAHNEPPPGSKEAMARKRDFSELVDLTALSDNEDYVMSRKQPRIESHSPESVDLFKKFQQDQILKNAQQLHAAEVHPRPGYPQPTQPNGTALRFDPNRPQRPQGYIPLPYYPAQPAPPVQVPSPTPAQQQARSYKTLAKPVDKQEAFRKTYYDAKTVARDLLIAAGRHPTERPLNAHLAGLLGKHIDIDSDLNTFDWDAIDPGGPPVPEIPYADVPMDPPRFALKQQGVRRPKLQDPASGEAQSDSAQLPNSDQNKGPASPSRSQLAPALSTNGDTTPGRGREGKLRSEQPQSSEVPVVSTDLGQPHLVQRGRPPRTSKKPSTPPPNSVVPQKRRASLVVSPSNTPASESKQSARAASSQLKGIVTPSTNSAKRTMEAPYVFPSGKRRGRPPGSKNIHPTFGGMKKIAAAQLGHTEVSAAEQPALPTNPVFRCRWKACHAHLHNLETIRNHISKVHRPTGEQLQGQGGYICWWKKCKLLVEDEDGNLGPSKIFDLKQDWLAHIEEAHLKEIAQKFGDGPSLKHIGKQIVKRVSFPFDMSQFSFVPHPALPTATLPKPFSSTSTLVSPVARTFSYIDPQTILQDRTRYLSSTTGQITTPDVTTPSAQEDLSPDTMRLLKAGHLGYEEQAQRAFMKTHRQEKSSPKAVAEETMKAMSNRKATIGAGIDKGGCILVNEERRGTLIQNPGIQRVVEGDY